MLVQGCGIIASNTASLIWVAHADVLWSWCCSTFTLSQPRCVGKVSIPRLARDHHKRGSHVVITSLSVLSFNLKLAILVPVSSDCYLVPR